MNINQTLSLDYLIESEGSELNLNPPGTPPGEGEPGGASRYGVSVSALSDYYKKLGKPPATIEDIINLTESAARAFYVAQFMPPIRFDDLPSGVDYRVFDAEVNLGVRGGIDLLQDALKSHVGLLTDADIDAAKAADAAQLISDIGNLWLAEKKKTAGWAKYAKGWTNRNNRVTLQALQMAQPKPLAAALTPAQSRWPLQSQCIAFYGDPRQPGWLEANTVQVPCPWPLHFETSTLHSILIHKKVAASLTRVLNNVWNDVGKSVDKINALHYDRYSGSYNFRPIRSVSYGDVFVPALANDDLAVSLTKLDAPISVLSMHAFAAAIDWDAEENQQHSQKHLFTDQSPLIVEFKKEGAVWGGNWSGSSVDGMHLQFARVK
jgi:lysozyme family protein